MHIRPINLYCVCGHCVSINFTKHPNWMDINVKQNNTNSQSLPSTQDFYNLTLALGTSPSNKFADVSQLTTFVKTVREHLKFIMEN